MAKPLLVPPLVLGPHGRIISITFCGSSEIRIRDIVERWRARITIKYPGIKPERMVECESPHERNRCVLLDCDPDVRTYSEQPCEIAYVLNGKLEYHYPDLLVEPCCGLKQIHEVKLRADAGSVAERTSLLTEELPFFGYSYWIDIAEEFEVQPKLANANRMIRFGRRPISKFEREFIRRQFEISPTLSWGSACAGHYGPHGRALLCRLFLEGAIATDVDVPISPNTRFWLRKGVL